MTYPIFISLTESIIILLELVKIKSPKNNKNAHLKLERWVTVSYWKHKLLIVILKTNQAHANKKKGILGSLFSQLCLQQSSHVVANFNPCFLQLHKVGSTLISNKFDLQLHLITFNKFSEAIFISVKMGSNFSIEYCPPSSGLGCVCQAFFLL